MHVAVRFIGKHTFFIFIDENLSEVAAIVGVRVNVLQMLLVIIYGHEFHHYVQIPSLKLLRPLLLHAFQKPRVLERNSHEEIGLLLLVVNIFYLPWLIEYFIFLGHVLIFLQVITRIQVTLQHS